jgi:hypothetical protein
LVVAFKEKGNFKLSYSNAWEQQPAVAKHDKPARESKTEPDKQKPAKPKAGNTAGKPTAAQLKKALTKENYDKIKRGMTEKEVVAILGSPSSRRAIEQHAGFVSRRLMWQLGQAFIVVVFHNGKVDAMDSGDGNGGPLPSGRPANPIDADVEKS